jgi:hypothetical protein
MRTAAALLFALASAVTVAAQSPAQRERERREREDREREAQFDLLMAEEFHRRAPERREPRPPDLTKIREDYVQLQVTNNDLAARVASATGDSLDLKAVASAAAAIRKRAGRLKENLALPEPNGEEARPPEPEELKPTLAALDQLILRFVRNPVFTSTKLVDLRHSAEAARDLERIIGLSGRVKKMCEKSRAAAAATPKP